MHQSIWIRAMGIVLVATLSLSIGTRPSLQAQSPPAVVSSAAVGGAFGGDPELKPTIIHVAAKPLSKEAAKIASKLQEKITMAFPNDTPLEEVVKYIRQCTVDKADFPEGIPIYLNPVGLQEAEKTSQSTIMIDLKGIPLATSLKLTLDQLSLAYWIHPDGLLIITSKDSEEIPVDADGVILEQLAALRQEIKILREEIRFSRGMPSGGMYSGPLNLPPETKPPGSMGSKGGMM